MPSVKYMPPFSTQTSDGDKSTKYSNASASHRGFLSMTDINLTHRSCLVIQAHAEHDSPGAWQPDLDAPLQLTGCTVIQAHRQRIAHWLGLACDTENCRTHSGHVTNRNFISSLPGPFHEKLANKRLCCVQYIFLGQDLARL